MFLCIAVATIFTKEANNIKPKVKNSLEIIITAVTLSSKGFKDVKFRHNERSKNNIL